MEILSADQIRAWDRFTIEHEPISSINLMERAAGKCVEWITARKWDQRAIRIFCGKGNNGGDGLAIGRLLFLQGFDVQIHIVELGKLGTPDFQINLQRLHELDVRVNYVQEGNPFPAIEKEDVLIDALFGSGLNKPLVGIFAELIEYINASGNMIVSIDLPSGMFIDQTSKSSPVVRASYTLTFQCYKECFLVQENAPFIGQLVILNIGLLRSYLGTTVIDSVVVEQSLIENIYTPRNPAAHKGIFGHALIIAGGYGKMGAAMMACEASLRAGAGLTTAFVPACGYTVMQTALPEVMAVTDPQQDFLSSLPPALEKFQVIGVGPGIGTAQQTQAMMASLITQFRKPMVIDADGLNCIALQKHLLKQLPASSIITPHPKEFDRLFGEHANDFDRIRTARQKATELNIIIVLKGHHTLIATPAGHAYYNSTGNAGMAKGGSGDVLTGILTALLSQGYDPINAAVMGVYMHGYAGDQAAKALSEEAMLPSDLITHLSDFFLKMKRLKTTSNSDK